MIERARCDATAAWGKLQRHFEQSGRDFDARDAFARAVRVASFVSAILGITAALGGVVFMKKRAVDASAQAR